MEKKAIKIRSQMDPGVQLRMIPGHFATPQSHITNYMDITTLKTRCTEAKGLAAILAKRYEITTPVDTIVCLDGTEVIGTYLAEELTKSGILSYNAHRTLYVVSPEHSMAGAGQIIFRDNLQKTIRNKHILVLTGSVTTGHTLDTSLGCIRYYDGIISGVSAIFSAISVVGGVEISAAFRASDVSYQSYKPSECPLCKSKVPLDALVNSFGYSKL